METGIPGRSPTGIMEVIISSVSGPGLRTGQGTVGRDGRIEDLRTRPRKRVSPVNLYPVPIFAHINLIPLRSVRSQSPPKSSVFAFSNLFIQALIYPELILFCQRAPRHYNRKEVTTHERIQNPAGTKSGNQLRNHLEVLPVSRGPRPHRALAEAIPIAQLRGVVQLAGLSPERIYDISIVSKLPIAFIRVMFAARILGAASEIADDFKDEIAQLRIIARNAAVSAELWLRSKHGTWRFFLVTAAGLIEIDRDGRPLAAMVLAG